MRIGQLCPACANQDCTEFACENPEACLCDKHESRTKDLQRQVDGLRKELDELKERFQRFLETNELWDGS